MSYRFMWFLCAALAANTSAKNEEFCAGKNVTEIVHFKLNAGVTAKDFRSLAAPVEKELRQLPGFERRQLLLNDAGEWIDIVHWSDIAQAKSAAEKMQTNPVAGEFFNLIAADSVVMSYYCNGSL